MKKMLMIISIASVFAACKSDANTDLQTNKVMLTDSSGTYNSSASSDTGTALQKGGKPVVISKSSGSGKTSTPKSTGSSGSTGSTGTTTSTNNGTTTTTTTTTNAPQKKGWSNRAKGAVIGGVAGAVGGAVISKHKGTGAAIGGVVGAAGGYIIGNEKDKKNGR